MEAMMGQFDHWTEKVKVRNLRQMLNSSIPVTEEERTSAYPSLARVLSLSVVTTLMPDPRARRLANRPVTLDLILHKVSRD